MRTRVHPTFEPELARRLRGARRIAIVGVGDELRREDRLGILVAQEIDALALPGVRTFLAGTVPESFTAPIRRFEPDHVVFVDAAEMNTRPGTVAVLHAGGIRGERFSTHGLPLGVVMRYVAASIRARTTLVGIQPDLQATSPELTPDEASGLTRIVACVQRILSRRPALRSHGLKTRGNVHRRGRPSGARRKKGSTHR